MSIKLSSAPLQKLQSIFYNRRSDKLRWGRILPAAAGLLTFTGHSLVNSHIAAQEKATLEVAQHAKIDTVHPRATHGDPTIRVTHDGIQYTLLSPNTVQRTESGITHRFNYLQQSVGIVTGGPSVTMRSGLDVWRAHSEIVDDTQNMMCAFTALPKAQENKIAVNFHARYC